MDASDKIQKLNDEIEVYKKHIAKAVVAKDNKKIMICILKLSRLPVTVENLEITSIGNVINELRTFDDNLGGSASSLVIQWKKMVYLGEIENVDQRNGNSNKKLQSLSSINSNNELQISQNITSSVASTSFYNNMSKYQPKIEASDTNMNNFSDYGPSHDESNERDKGRKNKKESLSNSTNDQEKDHIFKKVKRDHRYENVEIVEEHEKCDIMTSYKVSSDNDYEGSLPVQILKKDKKNSYPNKKEAKCKTESKLKSNKDEIKKKYKPPTITVNSASTTGNNKTFEEVLLSTEIGKKEQIKSKFKDRLTRSNFLEQKSSPISSSLKSAPLHLDPSVSDKKKDELKSSYKSKPQSYEDKDEFKSDQKDKSYLKTKSQDKAKKESKPSTSTTSNNKKSEEALHDKGKGKKEQGESKCKGRLSLSNSLIRKSSAISSTLKSAPFHLDPSNSDNKKNENKLSHKSRSQSHEDKGEFKSDQKDKSYLKTKSQDKAKKESKPSTSTTSNNKTSEEALHDTGKGKKEQGESKCKGRLSLSNSSIRKSSAISSTLKSAPFHLDSSNSDNKKNEDKLSHKSKSQSHEDKSEFKSDQKDKSYLKTKSQDKAKKESKPSINTPSNKKVFEKELRGIVISKKKQGESNCKDKLNLSNSSERKSSTISGSLKSAPLNLDPSHSDKNNDEHKSSNKFQFQSHKDKGKFKSDQKDESYLKTNSQLKAKKESKPSTSTTSNKKVFEEELRGIVISKKKQGKSNCKDKLSLSNSSERKSSTISESLKSAPLNLDPSYSDKKKDEHKSSNKIKSQSYEDKGEFKSNQKDKSYLKTKSQDKTEEEPKLSTSKNEPEESKCKDKLIGSNTSEQKSSPISSSLKLASINLNPEVLSPNSKPLTQLDVKTKKAIENADQLVKIMTTKNMRTKVYSRKKSMVNSTFLRLLDLDVKMFNENLNVLKCTEGVPFIINTVLKHATPDQLYLIEHNNNYLIKDTGALWEYHCKNEFRNKIPEKNETWRDLYKRCLEDSERKLLKLPQNINVNQAASTPVRKTQLAHVSTAIQQSHDIGNKQVKYNTATKTECNINMMGRNSSAESLSANNKSTSTTTGVLNTLISDHRPSTSQM